MSMENFLDFPVTLLPEKLWILNELTLTALEQKQLLASLKVSAILVQNTFWDRLVTGPHLKESLKRSLG